jgi:hypothetical protein
LHHEHSLIVVPNSKDLSKIKILYKSIKNTFNEFWEEGLRATREEDFSEIVENKEVLPCDVCENDTMYQRFICLNCRSLTLCENCFEENLYSIDNLDIDAKSVIAKEHRHEHVFLRVFDF